MNKKNSYATAAALAALLGIFISSTGSKGHQAVRTASAGAPAPPQVSFTVKAARDIAAAWPAEAAEAADSMLEKYGAPDEITNSLLMWRPAGPWLEVTVKREVIEHRFPIPHKDTLEQTVAYEVPKEKFDDLARFDGSIIAERTRGTLASRSQSEAMNFLALNLAHDIITNRRSVEDAREAHAYIAQAYMKGEQHPYTRGLRFQAAKTEDTRDPDYSPD